MNNTFRFILLPLFLCIAALLSAGGKKEVKNAPEEKNVPAQSIVQVTGRVRLVGNDPFPELVITAQDREWYIDKEDVQKLKDLQQRTVTVEGTETVKTITYASGRSAGERRTLKNIRIISVN